MDARPGSPRVRLGKLTGRRAAGGGGRKAGEGASRDWPESRGGKAAFQAVQSDRPCGRLLIGGHGDSRDFATDTCEFHQPRRGTVGVADEAAPEWLWGPGARARRGGRRGGAPSSHRCSRPPRRRRHRPSARSSRPPPSRSLFTPSRPAASRFPRSST